MRRPSASNGDTGELDWAGLAKTVLEATSSSPALDIGCGLGEWLAQYRVWFPGRLLVGMDVSRERVWEAAARSRTLSEQVLFVVAAAEWLPFKDGTFAAVTCRVVLSYVWVQPTLREMRRVMHPHGIAAIQVHSAFHYWALFRRGVLSHKPRLVGYAAWVAVNTAFLYMTGSQTKLTLLGRSGGPHTFLTVALFRRLLRSAGFSSLEPWPSANRGEPAYRVEAGDRLAAPE